MKHRREGEMARVERVAAIVAHAVFVGFERAVREMKALMVQARRHLPVA